MTTTSVEISESTRIPHKQILKDIKAMFDATEQVFDKDNLIVCENFFFYVKLTRAQALTLLSSYDWRMSKAIVDRLISYEK